jgi:hypothetical protein
VQIGSDIDGEANAYGSGSTVGLNADGTVVAVTVRSSEDYGDSSGHVKIYQFNAGSWSQLGNVIVGEASPDLSGTSLSLSEDGSKVAIGAYQNDGNVSNSGHVRIYEFNAGVWSQIGSDIDGEAAGDASGLSVSMNSDGSRVAIGAPYNNGVNGIASGHVRVYEFNAGDWSQIGGDIDGESSNDLFGRSVSMNSDGTKVAIGGPNNNGINGFASGHVRVYEFNAGVWTQIGGDIEGEAANDLSGTSVSLSADDNILAIAAQYNDGNGINSGHVRVYEFSAGVWSQLGLDIDGETANDQSGRSISLSSDGSKVAIGSDNNNSQTGHVRMYGFNAGVWTQLGSDIDGEAIGDQSGISVSLNSDGSILAIGAWLNDGSGTNSGHVRVYQTPTLSINDNVFSDSFALYPNPSKEGRLHIKIKDLNNEEVFIQIFDVLGKNVFEETKKINNSIFNIDTSELSSGIYFLNVNQNDKSYRSKFIIE